MNMQHIDDVIFRSATNADSERVIALVSGVLAEHGLQHDPQSTDADLKDIEGNYIRSGGVFEVIEDREGNLLGSYGLFRLDQTTCELRKMYFVPQIRGRGLGRRVMEKALSQARTLNYTTIVLETNSVLKRAIHLYTRFGFVPTKPLHVSARADLAFILKLER